MVGEIIPESRATSVGIGRVGRPTRPLHDPGNHRTIERGSLRQAARRGRLTEPARPSRKLGATPRSYTTTRGRITFHAKALLADQDLAYVGSANMTVFARHSMELGILVDGRASRVIANFIRGIEKISIPLVAL